MALHRRQKRELWVHGCGRKKERSHPIEIHLQCILPHSSSLFPLQTRSAGSFLQTRRQVTSLMTFPLHYSGDRHMAMRCRAGLGRFTRPHDHSNGVLKGTIGHDIAPSQGNRQMASWARFSTCEDDEYRARTCLLSRTIHNKFRH